MPVLVVMMVNNNKVEQDEEKEKKFLFVCFSRKRSEEDRLRQYKQSGRAAQRDQTRWSVRGVV